MGVVYKCRDVDLDRVVAIKTIAAGQYATAEQPTRFIPRPGPSPGSSTRTSSRFMRSATTMGCRIFRLSSRKAEA